MTCVLSKNNSQVLSFLTMPAAVKTLVSYGPRSIFFGTSCSTSAARSLLAPVQVLLHKTGFIERPKPLLLLSWLKAIEMEKKDGWG
jgi:hypothetical protein